MNQMVACTRWEEVITKLRLKDGQKFPHEDLQRLHRVLQYQEIRKLCVDFLLEQIGVLAGGVKINYLVGPHDGKLLRELADRLGAEAYLRRESARWKKGIRPDHRFLQVARIATCHNCFSDFRESLRQALKSSNRPYCTKCEKFLRERDLVGGKCRVHYTIPDLGVRPGQFVPVVIAEVASRRVIEFEGAHVISLLPIDPKAWKNNRCPDCGTPKKRRTVS